MKVNSTVAVVRCQSYDTLEVNECIKRLFALLGGVEKFIQHGSRVLIKPNLLTDTEPDEATTTHPEVVRAVIRVLKSAGCHPFVADSPAMPVQLEKIWEKTGIKTVCKEEDVPLLNLEKDGVRQFNIAGRFSFSIARAVLEADAIINIPKVKTHMLTVLTCAVKNMYGVVPGYQKTTLHSRHPTAYEFSELLVEIYKVARPVLNIADGIVGMCGDGPSAGKKIALGFLAGSPDGVMLDIAICQILGIDPLSVPYLAQFLKGKDSQFYSSFEITGDLIRKFSRKEFELPTSIVRRVIPGGIARAVSRWVWIRPVFMDNCIRCGRCVSVCPAKALTLTDDENHRLQKPQLDAKKCIECCCCHEICPEQAIRMEPSPLLRLVWKRKLE
jgi:uncharacterized protein (DUF362 family)/ferredoxin